MNALTKYAPSFERPVGSSGQGIDAVCVSYIENANVNSGRDVVLMGRHGMSANEARALAALLVTAAKAAERGRPK